MQITFSNLTPAQATALVAVATLFAAFIAGLVAFGVAAINSWSAGKVAKANSRREFRVKLFEPFLTTLDQELRLVRDTSI